MQIAPNWRVFVRAFVSADDRLNVTDRFDAVVSAPKIPFPGNRDRTTTLRPSNYPLRIAFLSGYNSRDGYAERLIGSIRRQCLDHIVVTGERHLGHILKCYMEYYNAVRTHLSLGKDAPIGRAIQRHGRIEVRPVLGGLHHQYVRI